jgi:hypothetical protein
MVKWEYLEVRLNQGPHKPQFSGHESCDGETKEIPASRVQKWFNSLEFCPNHYGKKGWELIKMGSGGDSDGRFSHKWYLFKRQK